MDNIEITITLAENHQIMLTVNFNPFPIIYTERLSLRQFTHRDVNEVLALRSDKDLMRFIPRPLATSTGDALEHIERINTGIRNNESISWAISLKKEDSKAIGSIGFVRMKKEHYRAEIGYMLHADYQRQGITQEALIAVVDYGFNVIKLHSIEAVVDPENTASSLLLEKNNFIREGHFKENEFYEGKFIDSLVYSRLNKK